MTPRDMKGEFSVKYSEDGKTIKYEHGFICGSDAVSYAHRLTDKGAIIYGIYRGEKQI